MDSVKTGFPGIVLQRRELYEQVSGYVRPYNTAPVEELRYIASKDPTVAACLEIIATTALSRLGEYENESEEIQEFVRANFEVLHGSFYDTCRELLSCLWAGFSVAEIVTELRGGKIWLHSLPVLRQEDLRFHLNEDRNSLNYGAVDYVLQHPHCANEARIPVEKCVIMRNYYSGGYAQDPYGTSRLLSILDIWRDKAKVQDDWAAAMRRYSMPFVLYKLYDPSAQVEDPRTGEIVQNSELARRMLLNWSNKDNAFIHGEGDDLTVHYPPGGIGSSFKELVSYYDQLIMRGLLLPSLLIDPGEVGSYALGQEHMALFQQGLTVLISNLTETLLEQLIRPLITWNFGPQINWGRFAVQESKTELLAQAQFYESLTTLGVLDKTRAQDVNKLRERFGFDELDEGEFIDWQAVESGGVENGKSC